MRKPDNPITVKLSIFLMRFFQNPQKTKQGLIIKVIIGDLTKKNRFGIYSQKIDFLIRSFYETTKKSKRVVCVLFKFKNENNQHLQ